jgi:CRISPR-associated endoribonuclease Cas6
MPTVIDMQLKATWAVEPKTDFLHSLACALFEGEGAEHYGQDKPFTIWPLNPAPGGSAGEWVWRVTWLPDDPPPSQALTADVLRVGHVSCAVTESVHRRVTHARMAAGPGLTSVMLTFRSPTYFSHNGSSVVIPDPRRIVGSWRRSWDSSLSEVGPLSIDEHTWRNTHPAIHLAEFDLRTERRDSGYGYDRSGFTGSAVLRLDKKAPASARAVLGTLARFAEYCGTGSQTTHGFGATTVTSESSRRSG